MGQPLHLAQDTKVGWRHSDSVGLHGRLNCLLLLLLLLLDTCQLQVVMDEPLAVEE